jgi:hypothetical protein
MDRYFPFHALGYRCNPFGVLTDEEWAVVAVLPSPVASALDRGFVHLQILGDKGHGKTTTLLALAARFSAQGKRAGYEYIRDGQPRSRVPLGALDVALIDEVQKLGRGQRARLARAARGRAGKLALVLSSHEDLASLFARFGLSVTTIVYDDGTPEHLRNVIERRLEYFALDPAAGAARATLAPEALDALYAVYHGDLRGAERCLYEVFQRLRGVEPVTAAHVRECATIAPTTAEA